MSRLRIVIDTNVVISAALEPSGLQAQVLELVAFRAVEMFVSQPVLDEASVTFLVGNRRFFPEKILQMKNKLPH
jgi:predicted nucleic acid-binding protein